MLYNIEFLGVCKGIFLRLNKRLNKNTDVMQQDADFITADFLYMFRASCAHHQEYKILTRQPPVQVVMFAGGSSLRHIRDEYGEVKIALQCNFDLLMMSTCARNM